MIVCFVLCEVSLVPEPVPVGRLFIQVFQVFERSNGRPVVDFCASGQDQYHQCGKTQAHHCQNQPGIMLHVPHS